MTEDFQEEDLFKIAYLPTDYSFLDQLPVVRGVPGFEINHFKHIGFQGSRLYEAYELIKKYLNSSNTVILAFPSNLISSGLRDHVTQLTKNRLIDVIITTGGGIEEDLIKTKFPFKYSSNYRSDVQLHQLGVNRTENLYIPNAAYLWLEAFLKDLFTKNPSMYNYTPVSLVKDLGLAIEDKSSYLYWAVKNNVLVIPLCIEDGAIGDFYANEAYNRIAKGQTIPSLNCVDNLLRYLEYIYQQKKKTLVICVGGNAPKHFALNGLIPFGGADAIVYLNNEPTQHGSNMGASPQQAISWGKSKAKADLIKVTGDFMFTCPLLFSAMLKLKRS